MKRTYFVPMCVLAGLLVCYGIAGVVLCAVVGDTRARSDEIAFVSQYKEPGNRQALYSEALRLRQTLSSRQRRMNIFTGATALMWGALPLWWALDRRRLIRKCNEPTPQETEETT